jgi:hypothetical protein
MAQEGPERWGIESSYISKVRLQFFVISRCVVVMHLYHTQQVKERAVQAAQILPESEPRALESAGPEWTRTVRSGT